MPGTTTRTQIPAEVNNFYDKNLLTRALPLLTHLRWGQVRDIPKNAGTKVIKFRRYGNLTAATTPLQEGVTPAGSQMSVTDITATVAQYGDYITVTDVVTYESQDAVLLEASDELGDQAGDTFDQLGRDVLNAGTSVAYGGSATSPATLAAGDVLTHDMLDAAILKLKKNNTKKITRQLDASTGFNTTPIRAAFIAIVRPETTQLLEAMTADGFVPVNKYPNSTAVMEGEVGSYKDIRFIETTNAKIFAGVGVGNVDVYSTIIFGANAYGYTRISGEALKNIVHPLGSAGSADALDQRATSGWKGTFVAKILNDNFITRDMHTIA